VRQEKYPAVRGKISKKEFHEGKLNNVCFNTEEIDSKVWKVKS
jgi:hypothetical protein